MRSTIAYFEYPYDYKESLIRGILIFLVIFGLTYFINRRFYIISCTLLTFALSSLYTNRLDETILYSILVGFIIYGYHFFRMYGYNCVESYKYTGQGIVISLLASIVGYISTYNYKKVSSS